MSATTKTAPRKEREGTREQRSAGRYTAARRAARAASSERSVRRQLVRGRDLLRLSVLQPDPGSRWPFAIIFGAIAAVSVIALLMLNTARAESSFTQRALSDELSALTLQEQQLNSEVAQQSSPQSLAESAAALGMVPGQNPGYLVIHPDGTVEWIEPKHTAISAQQAADAQAHADQQAAQQAAQGDDSSTPPPGA